MCLLQFTFFHSESIKLFQKSECTKMKQKSIKLLFTVQSNKRLCSGRHITLLMGAPDRNPLNVYLFLSQKEFPCFSVAHCQTQLDRVIVINRQIVYKCCRITTTTLLFPPTSQKYSESQQQMLSTVYCPKTSQPLWK